MSSAPPPRISPRSAPPERQAGGRGIDPRVDPRHDPRVDVPRRTLFDEAGMSGQFGAQATLPGFRPKPSKVPNVKKKPGWPIVPLPPAVVILVGLAVALAIGIVGIDQFARTGDDRASEEAELLASSLAVRLPLLDASHRLLALRQAKRTTETDFLVVDGAGTILERAMDDAPDETVLRQAVVYGSGNAATSTGPTRFAAHPLTGVLSGQALIAFVPSSYGAEGAKPFVSALLALTILLVGVAATVAAAVARDAMKDVDFVTDRIGAMSDTARSEAAMAWIPIRAYDEVGVLTNAFNDLVARFAEAEKSYLTDLDRATGADRERAAFLAAVSHELRSPLNAILGFADILLTEVDGKITASAREEVEQIRASGEHLLELINDILEFSALETGQLKLSKSPTDLTALVHEVVREQAVRLAGKPVILRVEGAPGIIGDVDARRVRQIVTNLVGNAIKFTQKGEIIVKVVAAPRYVSISVIDTGAGISEAERAFIFDEYKQAGAPQRRHGGTGLGLAIARRLVLLHSGTIQLESEIGRGSKFHVYLPIWRGRADAVDTSGNKSTNAPVPGIIEDRSSSRQASQAMQANLSSTASGANSVSPASRSSKNNVVAGSDRPSASGPRGAKNSPGEGNG